MTGIDKQVATWALVPLKSPERAKSRLAGVLNPEQRVRLFLALAEQVIRSLRATNGIDNVAVVTASAEIAAFSRSLHAVPLVQSADAGMSAALDSGLRELQALEPARVLMIPGDLPLIAPSVVEAFLEAAGRDAGITIVPDRHRVGTNLLLCTPPHAVAPSFGGHSFERHLAAAAAAGVRARVLQIEELALDLDEPDDLEHLRSRNNLRAAQLFDMLQGVGIEPETRDASRRSAVAG
jgi:2-phospho-L-lactate/phosphoenolpyruvate guanylyltransferase